MKQLRVPWVKRKVIPLTLILSPRGEEVKRLKIHLTPLKKWVKKVDFLKVMPYRCSIYAGLQGRGEVENAYPCKPLIIKGLRVL